MTDYLDPEQFVMMADYLEKHEGYTSHQIAAMSERQIESAYKHHFVGNVPLLPPPGQTGRGMGTEARVQELHQRQRAAFRRSEAQKKMDAAAQGVSSGDVKMTHHSWPAVEKQATKFGLAPAEANSLLRKRFPSGTSNEQAMSFLNQSFGTQQYEEAKQLREQEMVASGKLKPGQPVPFMSQAEWNRLPQWRQSVEYGAKALVKDPDTGRMVAPAGHVRLKDEQYARSVRQVIGTSYMPQSPGSVGVTAKPGKELKRLGLQGNHPQGTFANLPSTTGFIKPGPLSTRADNFQVGRSAIVLGGSAISAGEVGISPSVGPYKERFTKEIFPRAGESFEGLVKPGATFGPRQSVRLASNASPMSRVHQEASYKVLNVEPIPARVEGGPTGYRVGMEMSTPLEHASMFLKSHGVKLQGTSMDLSRIRGEGGKNLGLQFLEGDTKDWSGIAYRHFQKRDDAYLLEQVNKFRTQNEMKPYKSLPGSYADVAEDALGAYTRNIAPGLIQQITVPTRMTKSEFMAASAHGRLEGVPHRKVYKGYEVDLPYYAIVDDMVQQAGRSYEPKRRFLSRRTLENIKRHDPHLYNKIQQSDFVKKSAAPYKDIVRSALATGGRAAPISGTVDVSKYDVSDMMARARAKTTQWYKDQGKAVPEVLPHQRLQDSFMSIWQKEVKSPVSVSTPLGNVYMPSGQSLRRFRALGRMFGEEVSPLVSGVYGMAQALSGGSDKELRDAAEKYIKAQEQVATSEKAIINAQGAFLPATPGRDGVAMSGRRAASSFMLEANEVYFPNLAQQNAYTSGHVFRYPETGEESKYNLLNLSKAEAERRGLNPETAYVSRSVAQAMEGDLDGDNYHMTYGGAVQRGKDGKLYAANGKEITSPAVMRKAEEKAIRFGAGKLNEELALYNPEAPRSKADAIQMVQNEGKVRWMSEKQYVSTLREQAALHENIGPLYNTFVKGLSTSSGAGQEAMRQLFRRSHGKAQRPAMPSAEMMDIHKIAGAGGRYWYKTKESAFNLGEIRMRSASALIDMKAEKLSPNEKGTPWALTSQEVADILGASGNKKFVKAIDDYRSGNAILETPIGVLGKTQSLHDFGTSGMGQLALGTAVSRRQTAYKTGRDATELTPDELVKRFTGAGMRMPKDDAETLALMSFESAETQRKAVAAYGKHRPQNERERFEVMADAAIASGLVEPSRQQSEHPLYGKGGAVSQRGIVQYKEPIGPGPAPTGAGGASGGGGKGPTAPSPAPAEEPFGGGGGAPPGNTGQAKRLNQKDFASQIPAFMTGSKFSKMTTLYEGLLDPGISNRIMGQDWFGRTVSKKQNPALYNTVMAAQEIAPMLSTYNAQAAAIAKNGTPEQRELAKRYHDMSQAVMTEFPAELRTAFELGINTSSSAGDIKMQERIQAQHQRLSATRQRRERIAGVYDAKDAGKSLGRMVADHEMSNPTSAFHQAERLKVGNQGARAQYMEWEQLNQQFQGAKGRKAQKLAEEMNALADNIKGWNDTAKGLKPIVTEHSALLKDEIDTRKENLARLKSDLAPAISEHQKMLNDYRGVRAGLSRTGRREYGAKARDLGREVKAGKAQERILEQEIASREEQRQRLAVAGGIGTPRQTRAAPTRGQKASAWAQKTLDPQRMFYGSMMLSQGYYMLGMPLARAREQYLGAEMSRGRMEYALGAGGMSESVQRIQRQQALFSNIQEQIGGGVNRAIDPFVQMAMNTASTPGSNTFENMGYYGTYAVGGGMALAGARMFGLTGMAGQAGKGLWNLGKAAPSAIGGMAKAGTIGTAAGVAGATTAGIGAGVAVNEAMAGERWNIGKLGEWAMTLNPATGGLAAATRNLGRGEGDIGFESLSKYGDILKQWWNDGQTTGLNVGGGSGTDSREPTPVKIVAIEGRLAQASGSRISNTQSQDIITAFAEATGFEKDQLKSGGGWNLLRKVTNKGLDAGLPPEDLIKFIGQAPNIIGTMSGSRHSIPMMEYLSQFNSVADLQDRQKSGQAVAGTASRFGMSPESVPGLAEFYKQVSRHTGSDFRADRSLSQLFGMNQYDFSDRARSMGMDHMALVNERGAPVHQAQQWAIQDRQHTYDFNIGQQRGRQEIEWARELKAIDQEFWDFRREQRQKDFDLGQRQYDLTIKQMKHNLEMEEERAELSKKNYADQYAISKKMFDLQGEYQREDFGKQEERMNVQRAWQLEDFTIARDQFETTANWRMEDLQRAKRYSTGRQRMDIMRQIERVGVQQDWKREEMDRNETRAQTSFDWKVEDLDTAKERFEELRPLQAELMRLQYEGWEKSVEMAEKDREFRKEMMADQLQLMEDRKADAEWQFATQSELEERQKAMQSAQSEAKLQWREMDLDEAARREEEYQKQLGWQRQITLIQQEWQMAMTIGFEDAAKKSENIRDYWLAASSYAKEVGDAFLMMDKAKSIPENPTTHLMPGVPFNTGNKPSDAETNALLAGILSALSNQSKGTITIDLDQLRDNGFMHVEDWEDSYFVN